MDTVRYGSDFFAGAGIGLGSALAMICSWERNRSILWALIASFLSWVYVVYFALTRRAEEKAKAPWRRSA